MKIKDRKSIATKPNELMGVFDNNKEDIVFNKRRMEEYIWKSHIQKSIELRIYHLNVKVKCQEYYIVGSKITFIFKIVNYNKKKHTRRKTYIEKKLVDSIKGLGYKNDVKLDGKNLKVILNSTDYMIPIDPLDVYKKAEFKHPTDMILGVDSENNVKMVRLSEQNHVLMSGMPGTGKTLILEQMLLSVLNNTSPNEVKIGMIDPKPENISPFVDLPFMIVNPVTDIKEILSFLNLIFDEIEKRLNTFSDINVINIKEYKKKVERNESKNLPYWIITVEDYDELYYDSREISMMFRRILQNAHRVGIYFVISNQKYEPQYFRGVNEQLMKTRIATRTLNNIDSERIIGDSGAQFLNVNRDMLVKINGEIENIQPHEISFCEIKGFCDYIKRQK